MTILDRYLARTILLHTLMVMAVLLALMTLVTFIGQQDDIGQGSYDVAGAFLVTLLQLPQQAYQLLPIGALIGAIIGLGGLARDSELTVVRAAGVSVGRIAVSAALAGVVVAALLWVIGEYFAPPADQYARQFKIFSRYSQLEFTGSRSAWVREGPYFINVRRQAAENLYGGIFVYELDAERRLTMVGRAETAAQDSSGRWVLTNYAETRLAEDATAARTVERLVTDARFNADFFGVAVAQPDSLRSQTCTHTSNTSRRTNSMHPCGTSRSGRASRGSSLPSSSACSRCRSPSVRCARPGPVREPWSGSWQASCSSC